MNTKKATKSVSGKTTPKSAPKSAPKAAQSKGSKSVPPTKEKAPKKGAAPVAAAPQVTHDDEDHDDEAPASSAPRGESAPQPAPEVTISLKNFRHHPDMENFYRFIYESDLRFEALAIFDQLLWKGPIKALPARSKNS